MLRLAERIFWLRALGWGASLGLIILLRPVNGLVLLAVPVVLGRGTVPFLRSLLGDWRSAGAASLACAAVVSVQCILWYAQVGHFIADGYKGEGFHWDRPEFAQVLIGFRRGLFLWTPVLILAAAGVLVLLRKDRWRAVASLVYGALNTYVIASWWIWYYGSGWGARVYIEHYPVLFFPLALVLSGWIGEARKRWLWGSSLAALSLASVFTLAQFYQYNHRLLDVECMDARKYACIFLRFDETHRDRLGGMYRVPPFNPNGMDTLLHEKWDAEGTWSHWYARRIRMDGAPSAEHVAACDVVDGFGPSFTMRASEFPAGRALFLAIGFERYVAHPEDTRSILCVAALEDTAGTQSYYTTFAMEPLPPQVDAFWEHIEYRVSLPAANGEEDLKFYFWNKESKGRFRLDDLDVTVMAVREY